MPAMTTTADPREEETGLSLQELMMLPVILLWMTFQVFAQHVVKLKQMRRTKPLPASWREHWPNLRLAEWHIRSLTCFGIEALLAGHELDVHELPMVFDPPEEFGAMPASAWEMHRRFEAIARFYADPERYIRRAAERILARDGEIDPLGRADPRPAAAVVVIVVIVITNFSPSAVSRLPVALRHASHPAQPIRAPPWLGATSKRANHIASLIPISEVAGVCEKHRARGLLRGLCRFSFLEAYFAAGTSAL